MASRKRTASSRSSEQEFVVACQVLDSLFQKVAPEQKGHSPMLAHFRKLPNESVLFLVCTDAANVWRAKLGFADFLEHKNNLQVDPNLGWKELFTMIQTAFQRTDKLSFDSSNSNGVCLQATYTLSSQVELSGKFFLTVVDDMDHYDEWDRTQELSNIIMTLLSINQAKAIQDQKPLLELADAKTEIVNLKAKVESLENEIQHLRETAAGAVVSSVEDASSSTQNAKKKAAKRKNMSVINPGVKRRTKRGVKIGES